jgi:hypothetical protein
MLWVLYALNLGLVWFENKCIVQPRFDRPIIFSNAAILWVLRLTLTYGVLAGLWFVYGIRLAGIALGAFYVFNKWTFGFHCSREVRATTARCMRVRMEEAARKHEQIDELKIGLEAQALATQIVMSNVKGGGP